MPAALLLSESAHIWLKPQLETQQRALFSRWQHPQTCQAQPPMPWPGAGTRGPAHPSKHNPQLQEKAFRTVRGGITDSALRVLLTLAGAHQHLPCETAGKEESEGASPVLGAKAQLQSHCLILPEGPQNRSA